jgi:predicted N-formylglutamate amidohydrolase
MPTKPIYERYESHEVYGYMGQGPFLLTCEHASNRVPSPLRSTAEDRRWLDTHWGWDIGARTVCREIIRATRSFGVFARYSRLVCDANRAPEHPHLIRCAIEGEVLSFNGDLDIDEVDRRLLGFHAPYHAAVDRALGERMRSPADVMLLSVHSFTPKFGDENRFMDVGVLFHPFESVACRLAKEIESEDLIVALNEPYSARNGLMYAATRHGSNHAMVHLELEINQKLIGTAAGARRMGRSLARALQRLKVRGAIAAQ